MARDAGGRRERCGTVALLRERLAISSGSGGQWKHSWDRPIHRLISRIDQPQQLTSGTLRGLPGTVARDAVTRTEQIPRSKKNRLLGGSKTGATGLEPATSGVTGRRSNQLSYAPLRVCPVLQAPIYFAVRNFRRRSVLVGAESHFGAPDPNPAVGMVLGSKWDGDSFAGPRPV